ncbi:MAG: Ig-like domain-containing protein [Methanomicrobiales archaeon]|nr:Ig-like domain-containing protein [Methanomicrobiales archaeon]
MKVEKTALLLTGLLVLVASASAAGEIPDHMEIASSNEWIVANGLDSATITVRVLDAANNPVQGATVTVQNLNPSLGSLSGTTFTTDVFGQAYPKFTANTVSGAAQLDIRASAWVNGTENSVTGTYVQYIDHSTPYRYSFIDYNSTAYVNDVTPIVVRMLDRYGNAIDSRRESYYGLEAEKVQFSVSSPENGARFLGGTTQVAQPVDANGNATAQLRISPYAGENIVLVTPQVSTVPSVWITITGVGGTPAYIVSMISPAGDPPNLPADGMSRFTILYTVYDQWGNPCVNREINITTEFVNSTEPTYEGATLSPTNLLGQSSFKYGPKRTALGVNINAEIVGFEDVARTDTVWFTTGTASQLTLTASPNPIPSWDVPGNPDKTTASIIAKVMDEFGNPVPGANVTFWIDSDSIAYDVSEASVVSGPILWDTSALTDDYGYAIVTFQPGEFVQFEDDPANWTDKATGSCLVKAAVETTPTGAVSVIWKNYPYLSVGINVTPLPVNPGEVFDVLIRLDGDGHALRPKPIDVILCTNRGESMLADMYYQGSSGVFEDKMVYLKDASTFFLGQMTHNYDRVGLVSYGINGITDIPTDSNFKLPGIDNTKDDDFAYTNLHYTSHPKAYGDYTTVDSPLQLNHYLVEEGIEGLTPSKDPTGKVVVPMRYGLYRAIKELNGTGSSVHNARTVKAVILLADRSWSTAGDPIAGWDGTSVSANQGYWLSEKPLDDNWPQGGLNAWTAFEEFGTKSSPLQNMANYAIASNVRIYSIAYFPKGTSVPTSFEGRLQQLAYPTGGKYYLADDAEKLATIYSQIAGELKTEAGVNTTMDLSMDNIRVNNITMSGGDVFDYVYSPGINSTYNQGNSTKMWKYTSLQDKYASPLYYNDRIDQSDEWNATRILNFDLGTIHLNQTWEIQYRMRVKEGVCGDIQLLDNSSRIFFNNGADNITLPQFTLEVPCNATTIINVNALTVDITDAAVEGDTIRTAWDFHYTGPGTVTQTVSYRYRDPATGISGDWVTFETIPGATNTTTSGTSRLFTQNLPYGYYTIRVYAQEEVPGGVTAQDTQTVHLNSAGTNYIRLQ